MRILVPSLLKPKALEKCFAPAKRYRNIRSEGPENGEGVNLDTSKWVGLSKMWDWWSQMKGTPKPKDPKWLSDVNRASKTEIDAITRRLLSQLFYTKADDILSTNIEILYCHLARHPEGKQYAIKMGCIDKLVEIRFTAQSDTVKELVRKTLSALGYADPPKSRGVRILSIDGGGIRGIAVVHMLKEIEKLTQKRIVESFDLICGVSTGSIILGCMLPPMSMTLEDIERCYNDLSSKVFNQSAIIGTGRMLWYHGYYNTQAWEKLLKSYVGDTALIETAKYDGCPKALAISCISVQSRVAPFIFRNYGYPKGLSLDYFGTYTASIFETVRASCAAPTVFEEIHIDGIPHTDGGIVVNNPTALAIHEAKNLWPNEEISCLVSCGTGLHDPILTLDDLRELTPTSTSWMAILDKIRASATDTEAIHGALNNLLYGDIYFRLNPPMSQYIVMDEVEKKNLSILIEDTKMYCRRNKDLFEELAKRLMLQRSNTQAALDYAKILRCVLRSKLNKPSQ